MTSKCIRRIRMIWKYSCSYFMLSILMLCAVQMPLTTEKIMWWSAVTSVIWISVAATNAYAASRANGGSVTYNFGPAILGTLATTLVF